MDRVYWLQVMGPDKAYLVQHTDNTRIFWADRHELVLGDCFKGKTGAVPRELLDGVRIPWHPFLCLLHPFVAWLPRSSCCRTGLQGQ